MYFSVCSIFKMIWYWFLLCSNWFYIGILYFSIPKKLCGCWKRHFCIFSLELFWIIKTRWRLPDLWLNLIVFNCAAAVPACNGSHGPFILCHVTAIDVESNITAQIEFPILLLSCFNEVWLELLMKPFSLRDAISLHDLPHRHLLLRLFLQLPDRLSC